MLMLRGARALPALHRCTPVQAQRQPAVKRARVHRLPPSTALPAGARIVGPLTPQQQQLLLAAGGADGFEVSAALAETEASLGLQGLLDDTAGVGSGPRGVMAAKGNTEGGTLVARLAGEVDSDDDAEALAVLREREDAEEEAQSADVLVKTLLQVCET